MRSDVKAAVENFKKAFTSLKDGVKDAKDELQKDGVIQMV
jgi:hypothetical protein